MNSLKLAIFKEIRNIPAYSAFNDEKLNEKMFSHADGLRLTYPGLLLLSRVFTPYHFPVPPTIKARHRMGLSKLDYPYYISQTQLVVFSDMDAMVIKLAGGIEQFLENNYLIGRE